MPGCEVIHHYLAGAASALGIYLEEDDFAISCDSKAVFIDEAFNYERVMNCLQESSELTVDIESDRPFNIFHGNPTDPARLILLHRFERLAI